MHVGQADRGWRVLEECIDPDSDRNAEYARRDETVTPSPGGDDCSDDIEGESFADRVRGVPQAVAAAAFMQAEPVGDRDDGRGRGHPLEPSIECPQHDGDPDKGRKSHQQVDDRSDKYAQREKKAWPEVIGKKSVEELAQSVAVKKCRADRAELLDRVDAVVDDRFLDDRETQPAGINEAVAERYRQHHAYAVPAKFCIDVGGGGLCQGHYSSLLGDARDCQNAGPQANLTIILNSPEFVSTGPRATRCTGRNQLNV